MRIILSVFAIVHYGKDRTFQARTNMGCDSIVTQADTPALLAKAIKEEAIENKEEIGISFQPLIKVLVTKEGKVSGEDYDHLSREEETEFLSELRKDD